MKLDEKIINRFDELVTMGRRLLELSKVVLEKAFFMRVITL
jgi:hypothetical protein